MKTTFKKMVSWIAVAAMAVSIFPTSAFALDAEETNIDTGSEYVYEADETQVPVSEDTDTYVVEEDPAPEDAASDGDTEPVSEPSSEEALVEDDADAAMDQNAVTASVTIRVQSYNTYMAPSGIYATLEVSSDLAESYGYTDKVTGAVSALDVLVKAHEVNLPDDFTKEDKDKYLKVSDDGIITTIFRSAFTPIFLLNGAYPNDGTQAAGGGYNATTVNTTAVASGDVLDFVLSDDNNTAVLAYVDAPNKVTEGTTFEATTTAASYSNAYLYKTADELKATATAAQGARLGWLSFEGNSADTVPVEEVQTDANGKAMITAPESAGTYYLVALDGDTLSNSISYPIAIEVEEKVEPVKASVTVRAQADNAYLCGIATPEVASDLAESYGYTDNVTGAVSALDALVKAHELMFDDAFTKDTKDVYLVVSDEGYVSKIFGEETYSNGFSVNCGFPNDGTTSEYGYNGTTVNQTAVSDGDVVDFFFLQDTTNWSDNFTFVEVPEKVYSGETFDVTVKGLSYYSEGCYCGTPEEFKAAAAPKEGLGLGWLDIASGTVTAIDGAVSDANGKVTLTAPETTGIYNLVALNGSAIYTIMNPSELTVSTKATVTIRAQADNAYLCGITETEVDANLAESYGYTDHITGAVSALDVLVKAHELIFGDDFTAETKDNYLEVSKAMGYVEKLFGVETYNNGFALNCGFPNDGTDSPYGGYNGTTVSYTAVADGDVLDYFIYQDKYCLDYFTFVDAPNRVFVGGGTFDVTLTGVMYGYYGSESKTPEDLKAAAEPIEDIELGWLDLSTGAVTAIDGAVSDENGKITVAVPETEGTYYLVALNDSTYSFWYTIMNPTKVEVEKAVKSKVTVRAQSYNEYLMGEMTATVSSDLAESYGYTDNVSKSVSALDAIVAAHVEMYGDDFNADTKYDYLSVDKQGFIYKLFGEQTSANGFLLNCGYPNDGTPYPSGGYTGTTVSTTPVANGDVLDFFIYQDRMSYGDIFTFVEAPERISVGSTFEVIATGVGYMTAYEYKTPEDLRAAAVPYETLEFGWADLSTGTVTPIDGVETDANGKATITAPETAGRYDLVALDGNRIYTIMNPSTINVYTDATVTIRAQSDNSYLMGITTVDVYSDLAESYGYTDKVTDSVSALDVLVKAHELMFGDAFTEDTKDAYLKVAESGTVSVIFGNATYSNGFLLNCGYPNDGNSSPYGGGYNGTFVNNTPVEDGDVLDYFIYQDSSMWSDEFTYVEVPETAYTGREFEVTVKGVMYMMGYLYKTPEDLKAAATAKEGVILGWLDMSTGTVTGIEGAIADENGKITATAPEVPGTYYLVALNCIDPEGATTYTILNPSELNVKLDTPVLTSVMNLDDGLSVMWSEAKGALRYQLFRSVDGASMKYLKTVEDTEYIDANVVTGTEYTYKVRAVAETIDGVTVYGDFSDISNPVVRLENTTVTYSGNTKDGLTTKWTKVDGAAGYYVYRSINGKAATMVKFIDGDDTTVYNDTSSELLNGDKVRYKIIPCVYNSEGEEYLGQAAYGNVRFKVNAPTITGIVQGKHAGKKAIRVNWTKAAAESDAEGTVGYYVMRSVNGKAYTKVATVSTKGYYDYDVTAGNTYSYKVYAYKTNGKITARSIISNASDTITKK